MKVLIIGGGLAGLSAAVELTSCGAEVELVEATRKLGGRIKAINFPETKFQETDYGQHVISGSYENLFALLKKIGAPEISKSFEELKIFFAVSQNNFYTFDTAKGAFPFNLLSGLFRLKHLTLAEKFSIIRFLNFVKKAEADNFGSIAAGEILTKYCKDDLIKKFWDKILVSIFNTRTGDISARLLIRVLQKLFLEKKGNEKIYVPRVSLNQSIIQPAIEYLNKRNFKFSAGEKAVRVLYEGNKVTSLKTNRRVITNFDFVVSALPPEKLAEIINHPVKLTLEKFSYSPILTAYIRLKNKLSLPKGGFVLTGSKIVDWLFNFGDYITVVASNAFFFHTKLKNETEKEFIRELKNFSTVFSDENVLNLDLIKIKNATIMSDIHNCGLREQINSPFSNLLISGDWVNTVFPPTIENAVFTGFEAAREICSLKRNTNLDNKNNY